jgi:hypothetical protein
MSFKGKGRKNYDANSKINVACCKRHKNKRHEMPFFYSVYIWTPIYTAYTKILAQATTLI